MFYCVHAYQSSAHTQRFARNAPDTAAPSESPLHFADRMAESVIVGYYTSAEVPFPRRKQPGCAFAEPFSSVRRTYIAHGWCERGFQRGAASLAHDFGTKSCVLLHLGQHRTIPALRLKHRSGGCGTASALPKCSIRHPVLSALLAWHLPHLARRIGT